MRKGLISICTTVILVFGICGCAQTAEEVPVTETKTVEAEHTKIESVENAAVDAATGKEEKAVSEEEYSQGEEQTAPIYIFEPQLTQDDTYEM